MAWGKRWGTGRPQRAGKPRKLNKDGTARKSPDQEEHEEQVKFVQWFRFMFPGVLIYAVPNGGDRNPAVAAKIKAEGGETSIPDLDVPAWHLKIEMKRIKGGRLSLEQKEKRAYFRRHGYAWLTPNGHTEAKRLVLAWLETRPELPRSEPVVTDEEIKQAA